MKSFINKKINQSGANVWVNSEHYDRFGKPIQISNWRLQKKIILFHNDECVLIIEDAKNGNSTTSYGLDKKYYRIDKGYQGL